MLQVEPSLNGKSSNSQLENLSMHSSTSSTTTKVWLLCCSASPSSLNLPTTLLKQARGGKSKLSCESLTVDAAVETMTITSSSEPLLSEAAYYMMQKPSFNAVKALRSVMERFAILKGDRGELLVLLLFTLARHVAIGPADQFGRPENRWFSLSNFLCEQVFRVQDVPSNLINEESIDALKNLVMDFPDAQLHFNRFVKLHEHKAIDFTSLRRWGSLCKQLR